MRVPVLEAIADAIMRREGWSPGTRSYRNRNPGNLRTSGKDQPCDFEGFRVFPSFTAGYNALLADLRAKVSGHNAHGLTANSTLLELFAVYSPVGDGNNDVEYAAAVAMWIGAACNARGITANDTLQSIFQALGEKVPNGVANT